MRAITVTAFGSPEGIVLSDLPEPEVRPGAVLVDVAAVGVAGVDAVIRRGTIGGAGLEPGFVPGSEVAGTVRSVGDGVDAGLVGRRVWGFTGLGGAYAEQAAVRVEDVVVLPDALSAVDAATLGSAGPVAHFGLAHAHLTAGETVLVRGAGGSIGIAAVELAARAGAGAVAVTTSSVERGARLRELGATHVLDRSGAGDGPDSFDVVLDVVGGPDMPDVVDRLAPNGRFVSVGIVGGYPPADFGTAMLRGFRRSISYGTMSLDTVPRAELRRVREDQFAAAVRGELSAVVHDVLPLEDAAEAHHRMDAGEVFGRIVLVPTAA